MIGVTTNASQAAADLRRSAQGVRPGVAAGKRAAAEDLVRRLAAATPRDTGALAASWAVSGDSVENTERYASFVRINYAAAVDESRIAKFIDLALSNQLGA